MSLFISLLPIYFLGNLHCLGMCGPLVFFLSKHKFRLLYFLGRIASYALVGLLAAEMGLVLNQMLTFYYIPSFASLFFGLIILTSGLYHLFHFKVINFSLIGKTMGKIGKKLSLLLLKDHPFAIFLFGFLTVILPCGQTLIVFSACALSADPLVGFFNGTAFALITSPSLYLAMHTSSFLQKLKGYEEPLIGGFALVVGVIAICRGLADLEVIPHFILSDKYHIALY